MRKSLCPKDKRVKLLRGTLMAKKILLILLIITLIAPLVGCQKKTPIKQIVLWASLSEEDTVRQIADEFTEKTGVSVKIVRVPFDELKPKFEIASSVKEGPDLITGPHDWVGQWATAKIISPVNFSKKELKEFLPVSLKAMSFEGKLYGLPIFIETIGLIYNKKLVKHPPETMDELIKIAQTFDPDKISGFLYDTEDFYFNFPFFSGYGGYIFKETKNGLDYNDIGLNNAGAIKAAKLIQSFQNLIPQGTNKDIANGRFCAGKLAFTITGPWALTEYKEAGIDYVFARIPKLENGKYPSPLVGVQGIMLNKSSKNPDLAIQFMQELANKESQVKIHLAGGRIPSRPDAQTDPRVAKNPDVKNIGDQAKVGTPMPNIPALFCVWQPMKEALQLINQGKLSPKEALDFAVERIHNDIKIQME